MNDRDARFDSIDWGALALLIVFVSAFIGSLGLLSGCTCHTYCANGAKDPKCYVAPDACTYNDEVDAGVR